MRPSDAITQRVTFEPLTDLEVERVGFTPDSVYVEYCLLPLIGPSCCLLYRHLGPVVCAADRIEVDLAVLARNLGLGARVGPGSAIVKALDRLQVFHLGAWRGRDRYALRRAVAAISDRHARRLPEPARSIHYRSVAHSSTADRLAQGRASQHGCRP